MQPASVSFFRFIISVILPPAARGNRRWLLRLRGRASERKRCATVVRASAPREAPIFGRARCCSCRRVCASARSTRSRGCDALWPRGARVLSAANAGQAATPVSSDLSTARAARGARRARAHLERADTIPACPPEATAATGSACALVSCPAATVVSCPVATLNKLGHLCVAGRAGGRVRRRSNRARRAVGGGDAAARARSSASPRCACCRTARSRAACARRPAS